MAQQPSRKIILVVDDEPVVRSLLQRVVRAIPGAEPLVASTADEALRLALLHPVCLVISDINMPGQTGVWLLKQLRERGSKAPVLFHSGSYEPCQAGELIEMGAAAFLPKPSTPSEILKAVSTILG